MTETPLLDKKTFNKFCRLIYDKAGIKLNEKKEALVSARVGKRMRKLGINDYNQYFTHVERDETGEELVELLNAISTNTTHFYREAYHFEMLTEIIKGWEQQGQHKFRIWCAAASTGEEPYTLAITLKEALRDVRDTKILATDISTKVLNIAKEGIYPKKQLEKVPRELFSKYFTLKSREKIHSFNQTKKGGIPKNYPYPSGNNNLYQITNDLRSLITFGRINLSNPPFPLSGPLDIIFCRNVMIYFDNEVRRHLLADMYRLLKPGGYLMVGHAESLSGMLSDFKSLKPAVYIKE